MWTAIQVAQVRTALALGSCRYDVGNSGCINIGECLDELSDYKCKKGKVYPITGHEGLEGD
jgi:hypothetical protein